MTTPFMLATVAAFASTIGVAEHPIIDGVRDTNVAIDRNHPHLITHHTTALQSRVPQASQTSGERSGILTTRDIGSLINVRTQPTTQAAPQGYGVSGEQVKIMQVSPGLHDNFQWYLVEFPRSRAQGWIREGALVCWWPMQKLCILYAHLLHFVLLYLAGRRCHQKVRGRNTGIETGLRYPSVVGGNSQRDPGQAARVRWPRGNESPGEAHPGSHSFFRQYTPPLSITAGSDSISACLL